MLVQRAPPPHRIACTTCCTTQMDGITSRYSGDNPISANTPPGARTSSWLNMHRGLDSVPMSWCGHMSAPQSANLGVAPRTGVRPPSSSIPAQWPSRWCRQCHSTHQLRVLRSSTVTFDAPSTSLLWLSTGLSTSPAHSTTSVSPVPTEPA